MGQKCAEDEVRKKIKKVGPVKIDPGLIGEIRGLVSALGNCHGRDRECIQRAIDSILGDMRISELISLCVEMPEIRDRIEKELEIKVFIEGIIGEVHGSESIRV
ncbi:MAG: hypothetical protein A2Y67_03415 [Candidatus Buchananbacteria bacterium RBG_13_39_9]|uniref:Uncharacterized protein n=1 Tax=Candidatus Buchananbacteria bacterium RBG_13_39_9 TaxID=1797531 RepID=A0A1G1XSF6_9BACT|nr:MAG: hypothetical protein A2Y67_03415 [Candidatus Buchananbacteria bacterium RBG_13_39_9]